jgi:redox-sensitive bicupin YhaK (pirin superfamily)
VTVIAGALGELVTQAPPPNSWAARAEADVAIWLIRLDASAQWEMPAARGEDTVRVLYVFAGEAQIDGQHVTAPTAVVLRPDRAVTIAAVDGPLECLLLQGRPIGEPVEKYGPFVMNDRAGIEQAFADYQRTGFGGWPWPSDDPVHPRETRRFARHADGRVETRTG